MASGASAAAAPHGERRDEQEHRPAAAPAPTPGLAEAPPVAVITGITGQDGSYLAELLLDKGYTVHGMIRRSSSFNTGRVWHMTRNPAFRGRLMLHYGDLTDSTCIVKLLSEARPSRIFNLGAQSHVKVSFDLAEYTANVDALGTLRVLDAMRACSLERTCRFYQASTSELYGKVAETPQSETTPFYPRSPYGTYRGATAVLAVVPGCGCSRIAPRRAAPRRPDVAGCAKLYSYWVTVNYREAYGLHACNGILFNHESPRRGATFVTRKISRAVAAIKLGLQEVLYLGNLDAKRDWGHAKDYVEAMYRILEQPAPDDFVIATGETHSVREFVERAFAIVGITIAWRGHGVDEQGYDQSTGTVRVRVDPRYFRPTEVDLLLGNPAKARRMLNWRATVTFEARVCGRRSARSHAARCAPRVSRCRALGAGAGARNGRVRPCDVPRASGLHLTDRLGHHRPMRLTPRGLRRVISSVHAHGDTAAPVLAIGVGAGDTGTSGAV